MPFLKAGFNGRNTKTGIRGWTRHIAGKRFAPAELRRFDSGDYFWLGEHFLAWGENVVLGTRPEFTQTWPDDLPQSKLPLDGKRRAPAKIAFTIFGEPASKANSRQLVTMKRLSRATGKMVKMPALIKSEKARDYERDALLQIPPMARARLEGPCRVTLHIFYATERPDLDESIVLDVMQDRYVRNGEGEDAERVLVQRGVYRNDRQVREKHVYWGKDPVNPRAEIEVEQLEPELQADLLESAA